MAEIFKKDMLRLWAETGDIVPPTDEKISEGWAVEVVPRQWWNWMQNRVDTNVAYMLQKGIPEWDGTTEYISGKSYVQHNNVIYKSIQTGTNQNPATATTYWQKALVESSASMEALKAVVPSANTIAYFTGATTAASTSLTAFARTLLDDADAATARGTLGAQQVSTALTAISGVTPATDTIAYFNGTTTAASTSLSSFGRTLIDDLTAAAARTTLELNNVANVLQAPSTRVLTAGNGLTGGGDLSADRTFTLGTPSTLTTSTTNAVTATSHTHAVTFPVTSVAGRTGAVVLTKADVGLSNVDNTSDANKPISLATQTALDGKSATSHSHLGLLHRGYVVDFNTALTEGTYIVTGLDLPNAPLGGYIYGKLVVLVSDGVAHDNASNWIWQEFKTTDGFFYTRRKVNSDTWAPWAAQSIGDVWLGVSAAAYKLNAVRTISLSGDVSGSAGFDGSGDVSMSVTVADNSHGHLISNVSGLQTALDLKLSKDNIVGTVSQSGGIPTGAIIERGSNANGEYVRFADGTQICTLAELTASAPNTAAGYVFVNSGSIWTFPATFSSEPSLSFAGAGSTSRWVSSNASTGALNSGVLTVFSTASSTIASSVRRLLAIGRWY